MLLPAVTDFPPSAFASSVAATVASTAKIKLNKFILQETVICRREHAMGIKGL